MTDGIDRLTEGAKVEVVEAQSATTPEEKAASREDTKKEHAPDAGVTPEQHRRPVAPVYYASVATTLLMVAILLAGIIGYRALPFRRCRKWTIQPFRWSRFIQVQARMS